MSSLLIRLEGIKKVFLTEEIETHALSGIHLDIAQGEYVSIAGPSGCGKSTLLAILGLLDTPSEGTYVLNDQQVANLDHAQRARIRNREIGFIFQSFNLIGDLTSTPSSAMNDLRFACRQLLKNPGFTAVAALTLALGIGANVVVLGWVRGVLMIGIPGAREPDRIVAVAMSDLHPGSAPEVVVSERFWRLELGGDPGIVGQTHQVNRHPVTIVGVADKGFLGITGGLAFDLWLPMAMQADVGFGAPADKRGWTAYHTVARLQLGIGSAQARAVAGVVSRRLQNAYPDELGDAREAEITVFPMGQCPWGAQNLFLPLLRSLAVAAALVLMLVIAHLANKTTPRRPPVWFSTRPPRSGFSPIEILWAKRSKSGAGNAR